jgi:hypothetical protein
VAVMATVFQATYTEEGTRLLLDGGTGVPPDTAQLAGDTMTVRAQFYRLPARERYVVVMTYLR